MAGVKFTENQQRAIDTIDKSLLVSAAAGSGKTAVLVERIISIILKGEANVDEMLVVTFTNAAAKEMKQKLTKAIKKHIQEHPETAGTLREQLNRMYRVYIQTFNSFAFRIVKEFFYSIDIEPSVNVCDEVKSTLLMQEAIDELFDLAFENDDYVEGGSFKEFLRLYSSEKNERQIKENILSAFNKLRSIPNYYDWARESIEILKADKDEFLSSHQGRLLREYIVSDVQTALVYADKLRTILIENNLDAFYKKGTDKVQSLEAEHSMIESLYKICSSDAPTTEIIDELYMLRFDRMPSATKEYKDAYEPVKDEVKVIRSYYKNLLTEWSDKFFAPDLETMISEMNETYKYTAYFINLIQAFESIFQAKKKEIGVIDFGDMDHYATKILEDEDIANILRERFKYIFIDEYQDTNNLQEYLINRFARVDNVFKVGDIKQSIYGFREAEPAIFERTRASYSSESNTNQAVIDLQKNFRSNSRTIDYVNSVFGIIMEGYDEYARLNPGLSFDGDLDKYDFVPEVHLLEKSKTSSDDAGSADNLRDGSDNLQPDTTSLELPKTTVLKPDEAEAAYVAKIVQGLIGTEFYDSKQGKIRSVEPGDIAILLNSVKVRGEYYTKALRDIDIDSQIEIEADYFDAIEIRTTLSLLQTIDNIFRDIPLIAVLHSEIFGFDADELVKIKTSYKDYCHDNEIEAKRHFYDAVEWYKNNGEDSNISQKLKSAINKLDYYREISNIMPLDQFIWSILLDSGYYMYAGAIQGGAVRQANLRLLVDRAGQFANENIATLSDFIDYLEEMQKKKVSPGQSTSNSSSSMVNIMTIHKSKGLEFPFVIVSSLGTSFIPTKRSKGCMINSELGLSLSYVRPDKCYWKATLLQKIIAKKLSQENQKERIRVLYVAMTRARNKLYMVGQIEPNFFETCATKNNNMLFLMGDTLKTECNKLTISELEQSSASKPRGRISSILKSRSLLSKSSIDDARQKIYDKLDYEYPYTELLNMQAKLSVSSIRKEILLQEALSKSEAEQNSLDSNLTSRLDVTADIDAENQMDAINIPQSSDEEIYNIWRELEYIKTKASKADIGNAYHRIMEQLDFTKVLLDGDLVDESYIKSVSEMLLNSGAIDQDVYKRLEIYRISKFFETELGKRACAASRRGELYKEKAFTYKMPYNGNETLVQGVIDCCFFEAEKAILIDYKSSFIRFDKGLDAEVERIRNEYRIQIDIYRRALEAGTGLPVSEAYLYLFVINKAIEM